MAVRYEVPDSWIRYDVTAVIPELVEAKSAVGSLVSIPFQRSWAEALQAMELKREVAGTSRIEGAEFTERELDEALAPEPPESVLTRSQRQARSAISAYWWIAALPADRPINEELIRELHARIVSGCDDDHCPPGQLRGSGENVTLGRPRHRGVEGGRECESAFRKLAAALNQEFRGHDPLIQALALHYHLGAMHPFHDGNGRTARAVEALILRRAHLKDSLFIAMSNYYYDEKDAYLASLAEVRSSGHDLTAFIKFGLKGIATQCQRLLREVRAHLQRSLFRDVMAKMYGRLQSTRKRALAERQCHVLTRLLEMPEVDVQDLFDVMEKHYSTLKAPFRAFIRDMNQLGRLGAIRIRKTPDKTPDERYLISVRLEWPTEITETEFYRQINQLPEAKTRLMVSP
jgi:Fic family protein